MRPAGPAGPSGTELASLGAMAAGAVIVPLLVGLLIDSAAHTGPIFLLIGLALGVVGAVAAVYVRFKQYL